MSYDPLGPDGAGIHAGTSQGVIPVSQSSKSHTNDFEDDYPTPGNEINIDSGGGSFDNDSINDVGYYVGSAGETYVTYDTSGHVTAVPVSEVVIDGHRSSDPTPTLVLPLGQVIQDLTPSSGTPVQNIPEIVVTMPRYDPCAGLDFNFSHLAQDIHAAPLTKPVLAEIADLPYALDSSNAGDVPGLTLQNKLVDDGKNEAIYVWQVTGSNQYVIAPAGTHSLEVGVEIATGGLVENLGSGAATYASEAGAFFSSVAATIHANDPGATVYLTGHSYGAALVIAGGAIFMRAGFEASQLDITAVAPVGASGVFNQLKLGYGEAPLSSITSFMNAGDQFRGLATPYLYGNLRLTELTPDSNYDSNTGILKPSLEDHSICNYVKAISSQ